ncbi:MAG: Type 1 glutamine amidotransferase-like domain-containing protein [Candidatus Riflebacteria bacterium]|nr:Type 1 glutamine amidotransferase-like domain-containing protein [Candidatus Riflebacteria bacterium]
MKGWILFNGNIRTDVDFVYRHADRMLLGQHADATVRQWRKVLLVTAAWEAREYAEGHVKEALFRIGIPSRVEGGCEQNIQNLSVYHDFVRFMQMEPEIQRAHSERQTLIRKTKEFYRRKNGSFLGLLRDQTSYVKELYPGMTLARILAHDVSPHRGRLQRLDDRELLLHYCAGDVQDTLRKIVENDDAMVRICHEIEAYFRDRSRVDENPHFIEMRDALRQRLFAANSIMVFGGNLSALLSCLQFFRLHDMFQEALWRGTSYYSVSAGSMVLAEKIIIYDDFWGDGQVRPRKEFEFFDNGLNLVTQMTLFPHCMDRIQTDDPDNLAYLAHRFSRGPCIGLNEESFLLVEPFYDAQAGITRDRFLSVGEQDGVYVFDRSGSKACRRRGEEVISGC